MISHVVMWKLAGSDAAEKAAAADKILAALRSLEGKIPGLVKLEVGSNKPQTPTSWDLVLLTRHASWEDLEAYRVHPDHLKVAEIVGKNTVDRAVVDFEG